jgi:hypothetical protein
MTMCDRCILSGYLPLDNPVDKDVKQLIDDGAAKNKI